MIPPVQPLNQTNLQLKSDSKENPKPKTTTTPDNISKPIEWFCDNCHNYFKVPDPIRYVYNPDEGELISKKELNCPFCGGTKIYNNKTECFREKLWQKI